MIFLLALCHTSVEIVFFGSVEGSSGIKPLSYEEEQLTRVFYEQKIQEVCAAFKFPHKIQVKNPLFQDGTFVSLWFWLLMVAYCFAGYSNNIFQEILFTMVCNGASPKAYHVSRALSSNDNNYGSMFVNVKVDF